MTRACMPVGLASLLLFAAACKPSVGQRCNPLQFDVPEQCSAGLVCIYPPNCGVAFCCPPAGDMTGAATPAATCLFPPNCSGDNCCPAMANGPPGSEGSSDNCLPCPAPDAAAN
jgi:hypothetical protein